MAKSVGIIGNVIGKLGNAVGYRIKDSNNKQSQGFRVYQPVVSNPKSYGQAVQRMRMKPINSFYRALKGFIDRGFEGVEYGNRSRLRFLSLAMSEFNGPYVPKGFDGVLPIPAVISKGSLSNVNTSFIDDEQVQTNLPWSGDYENVSPQTMVEELCDGSDMIKEGDQITFIFFIEKNGNQQIYTSSVVLDRNNDDNVMTDIHFTRNENDGLLILNFSRMENVNVLAGGIIVSRESASGQHLRSTCRMTINHDLLNQYFTDDAQKSAVVTYMAADGSSDWPEVIAENAEFSQIIVTKVTDGMTAVESALGKKCLGYLNKSGNVGVFYAINENKKQLLTPNGALLKVTVEGVTTNVTLSNDYSEPALEYNAIYGTL